MLVVNEERNTEGHCGTMLLLMHVGDDRTLSGFDCGGSDGALLLGLLARDAMGMPIDGVWNRTHAGRGRVPPGTALGTSTQ
jgi:hypothetical protein